jgi:hypothetical protein
MPAPAWEDLSDFFDAGEFATEAVVHFQAGGSRTVTGNYEDPYLDAKAGEYVMDTTEPRFMAPASALVGIRRGDTIQIPGEGVFDILTGPQPDGTGLAQLKLAKQ